MHRDRCSRWIGGQRYVRRTGGSRPGGESLAARNIAQRLPSRPGLACHARVTGGARFHAPRDPGPSVSKPRGGGTFEANDAKLTEVKNLKIFEVVKCCQVVQTIDSNFISFLLVFYSL